MNNRCFFVLEHVSDRNYPYLSFLLSRSNEYLSDQFSASETLALLARTVRLSLQRQDDPKKPGLPVWNKDYVNTREVWEAKQPSSELLKKLENELGFPVLDTSDMALLKDRMGKNLKRDRGDMSSGLPVITGTKQRDPSPEKKKPR